MSNVDFLVSGVFSVAPLRAGWASVVQKFINSVTHGLKKKTDH